MSAATLDRETAAVIEARIRAVEARTGAEIVVATVDRSDRFHGLRWRAFALATSVTAIVVVLADATRPDWVTAHTAIVAVGIVVGVGLVAALAASLWPAFARRFLQHSRAHAAVNTRARTLFLERECFAAPRRNAILLLAGHFERVAAVYADTGYRGRIGDGDWQRVADAMTAPMAAGDERGAFIAGLDAVEALLVARGFSAPAGGRNALPDAPLILPESP